MKKYFLLITTACICCNLFAQADRNVKQLTQYLFTDFTDGRVLEKSGSVTSTKLNYNTLTQEMIFKQGNQNLALANPSAIDTIYLNGRKFVFHYDAFYDYAVQAPIGLFIQYLSDVISSGAETGFGKTQTSAAQGLTDLKSSGKAYSLSLSDEYTIKNKTSYFLKKDGEYIQVNSVKDVKKVFAGKDDAIDGFVKSNKVNFKNVDDVIRLIQFCNSN